MKLRRYIVLRDGVVTKFPWIVVSADEGEPALWQQNVHIGKMPLRFRTAELAQAAADQLMAEQRKQSTTTTRFRPKFPAKFSPRPAMSCPKRLAPLMPRFA